MLARTSEVANVGIPPEDAECVPRGLLPSGVDKADLSPGQTRPLVGRAPCAQGLSQHKGGGHPGFRVARQSLRVAQTVPPVAALPADRMSSISTRAASTCRISESKGRPQLSSV